MLGRFADVSLAPAEWAYRTATAMRNRGYDSGWFAAVQAEIPVISVGNLAVGGSGKTPFTAWLADRISRWGREPAVVLRGYGTDEILLHREMNPTVPVFTGSRRVLAVRAAAAAGCNVAILDDAFQHRALRRDLNIVLVGADGWTRRRRLLPRGPWRESTRALTRADVVVVVRKTIQEADELSAELHRASPSAMLVECEIRPGSVVPLLGGKELPATGLARRSVLGIASLADPGPFEAHLRQLAASVELLAFPDHFPFTPTDAEQIVACAAGRPIVMTGKDAVKLRSLLPSSSPAYVLCQHVTLTSGAEQLDAAVWRVLEGGSP